jgi:hypothetical protein
MTGFDCISFTSLLQKFALLFDDYTPFNTSCIELKAGRCARRIALASFLFGHAQEDPWLHCSWFLAWLAVISPCIYSLDAASLLRLWRMTLLLRLAFLQSKMFQYTSKQLGHSTHFYLMWSAQWMGSNYVCSSLAIQTFRLISIMGGCMVTMWHQSLSFALMGISLLLFSMFQNLLMRAKLRIGGRLYDKLEKVYWETDGKCKVDFAFGKLNHPFLIKLSQDQLVSSAPTLQEQRLDLMPKRQTPSMRQAAEWGMQAILSSFPCLKDTFLVYEVTGETTLW